MEGSANLRSRGLEAGERSHHLVARDVQAWHNFLLLMQSYDQWFVPYHNHLLPWGSFEVLVVEGPMA